MSQTDRVALVTGGAKGMGRGIVLHLAAAGWKVAFCDTDSAVGERLADQLMLVLARDGDRPVAAALYFFDADCLYGRYWGCSEEVAGLHFTHGSA